MRISISRDDIEVTEYYLIFDSRKYILIDSEACFVGMGNILKRGGVEWLFSRDNMKHFDTIKNHLDDLFKEKQVDRCYIDSTLYT